MWWNILPTVFKTGAEIYKNHKQSEFLESEAEVWRQTSGQTAVGETDPGTRRERFG